MHARFSQKPFHPEPPLYPFRDRQLRNRFLQLVREFLGRGGKRVVIGNGVAHVEGSSGVHGLGNLAQICHQAPPAQWPEIVAEQLAKGSDARMEAAVDTLQGGFDGCADKLVVRVYAEEFLTVPVHQGVVHRTDLPGTCTVLALDVGPSIVSVPRVVADLWQVPVPELFDRALQNLPRLGAPHWSRLHLPSMGAGAIDLLSGDFHASAHVLRPATFVGRTGAHGNLVGLPARGVLLSHAIDAMPAVATLEALLAMTTGKFRDGPGAITPHLYWRTPEGGFHLQQGTSDGGRARFVPSPEFVELMVRLRGERAAGGEA
ncbi:MAG TPA: hypothetical protein VFZ65_10595 [Planctomycetota bacterium]|nr:hypothetical protein [Planctomycetota bacterium]